MHTETSLGVRQISKINLNRCHHWFSRVEAENRFITPRELRNVRASFGHVQVLSNYETKIIVLN